MYKLLLDERLRLMAARENRLHLESLQELRRGELEEEKAGMERSKKRKEVQKYQLAQVRLRQEERCEMLEGKFYNHHSDPHARTYFRTTIGRRRDETDN